SCSFDPDKMPREQSVDWFGDMGPRGSVLSCYTEIEQSCTYDPCFIKKESTCKPRCGNKCQDCGKQCAGKCESCKSKCASTDANCRTECAKDCATCREACVRDRDRCQTGDCAQEQRRCNIKLKADWKQLGCRQLCNVYLSCQERCVKKHGEMATDQCMKPCQ